MIDEFWLEDIDTPTELDSAGYLNVVARFPDGTSSHVHYIESQYDIPDITRLIIDDDMAYRVAALSPADEATYSESYDPDRDDVFGPGEAECTCRAACFCYDARQEIREEMREDAFAWLTEHARPGAIMTWWWSPFHASGTSVLTDRTIDFVTAEVVLETDANGDPTRTEYPEVFLRS